MRQKRTEQNRTGQTTEEAENKKTEQHRRERNEDNRGSAGWQQRQGWLVGWFALCVFVCLVWMFVCLRLAVWFWSVGGFVGGLAGHSVGRLVGWLVGQSVKLWVGPWVVGLLVDQPSDQSH